MQPKMDGKRCDSAGDLGGLPEDSDVDPRRIKTPLKFKPETNVIGSGGHA